MKDDEGTGTGNESGSDPNGGRIGFTVSFEPTSEKFLELHL